MLLLLSLAFSTFCLAQNFMVLGDVHFDRFENHDFDWVDKKGFRGEIEGYCKLTKHNWGALSKRISDTLRREKISAIVQLGDLSEGLAGSPQKARQMAESTLGAIREIQSEVPWVLVKGNHEITGPGAKEAYREIYTPFVRSQLKDSSIASANYAHTFGNVLLVCADSFEMEADFLDKLERTFANSKAKRKFLLLHEPLFPANKFCWYAYKKDAAKREKLLEIVAKNKVTVIAGHIHDYSLMRRSTDFGDIVQLTLCSVIRDLNKSSAKKVYDSYGDSLILDFPKHSPQTVEERLKIIERERPFVKSFRMMDLPGYGIVRVGESGSAVLEFYTLASEEPAEVVKLSD